MFTSSALFTGSLIHRRYLPRRHELAYGLTEFALDIDKLDEIDRSSWLFGYNRRKLFGVFDRNHGRGDGTPLARHVRELLDGVETRQPVTRIHMLTCPAVFGFVFNPLSVFFALSDDGAWQAVVFEVSNTFGERHSYVMPADRDGGLTAEKRFYVSPFNTVEGKYHFQVERTGARLRLNIALFENGSLKLCARYCGEEQPISDAAMAKAFVRLAVQPVKILAGIHWEALKLYCKGLRLTARPPHGRFQSTIEGNARPLASAASSQGKHLS